MCCSQALLFPNDGTECCCTDRDYPHVLNAQDTRRCACRQWKVLVEQCLAFLLDVICHEYVRSEARPHKTQCTYLALVRIQVKVSADEDEVPDSVKSPTKMAKHKRLAMLAGDGGNVDTDTDAGADEYEKPAQVSAMLMDAAAGAAEVPLQLVAAALQHAWSIYCTAAVLFLLCSGSTVRWFMLHVACRLSTRPKRGNCRQHAQRLTVMPTAESPAMMTPAAARWPVLCTAAFRAS